eukprot:3130332-Pleurochrysis_carterae.AAC.1
MNKVPFISVARGVAKSNSVGRIRFVSVQGEHPNEANKADNFDCLYYRYLRDNEISGTIPDVAALTGLRILYAAMPSNIACICVA